MPVDYDTPTDEELISVEYLLDLREKLGHPETADTQASWKLIDAIVKVWSALKPFEAGQFVKEIEEELKYERPVREAVKKGGYFKIQYPPTLYQLLKYLMPKQRLNDQVFIKRFLQRYPKFSGTNYKQ